MTEPLIDREPLMDVLYPADPSLADAVIDYLRSVLTPEALWDKGEGPSIGEQIHRRIFGEK